MAILRPTKESHRRALGLIALVVSTVAIDSSAHGFGQQLDLSLPLWLWMLGAGLSVIVPFAAVIDFLPSALKRLDYPRTTLLRSESPGHLLRRAGLWGLRLLVVAVFAMTIITALAGEQDPATNLAPMMVWVFFWVGVAFASALIGDLWAMLNPLRSTFMALEWLCQHLLHRSLSLDHPYPRAFGVWPAVILLYALSWGEHLWAGAALPFNLGIALLCYTALCFTGMTLFGREVWLRHGEVFAVVFGLLARFAPFEFRVALTRGQTSCGSVSCNSRRTECINGYICLDQSAQPRWEVNLRPPAVGLLNERTVTVSMAVFVTLLMSSVAFDGLIETPLWTSALAWVGVTVDPYSLSTPALIVASVVLIAMPCILLALLLLCCWTMSRLNPALQLTRRDTPISMHLASRFTLTLLPIAIAYHFAHYLTVLIGAWQEAAALISDPLGLGWGLLDSVNLTAAPAISDLQFVWNIAVAAILCGHIGAVYLAHVVTLDLSRDQRYAIRGQLPILTLMVAYTMGSIWILAQPSYA